MGLGSLGLDPTPITGTDPNEATNRINLHTHTGNPGEGDQIDSVNVINTPAGDITADNTQAAINELNVLANLGRVHIPVRQTVLHGLTDTEAGTPVFLQIGSGLAVSIAATLTPLIIAFAYNFDSNYGALDYIGKVTADVTGAWSSLPANQTCYLYIDRNIVSGALTYSYSLFAPAYQNLAPATPSTDQHWFDLNSFYMKRYNGTVWENKQRVFVGECVTGASSVTSVICYALQGKWDSGWFPVAANTGYTTEHKIGIRLHNGLQPCFYFSATGTDSDATFAHDVNTADISTVLGHYSQQDIQHETRNKIYFGFGSHVQTFRGAVRVSGYYRIFIKRGW